MTTEEILLTVLTIAIVVLIIVVVSVLVAVLSIARKVNHVTQQIQTVTDKGARFAENVAPVGAAALGMMQVLKVLIRGRK